MLWIFAGRNNDIYDDGYRVERYFIGGSVNGDCCNTIGFSQAHTWRTWGEIAQAPPRAKTAPEY